MFSQFAGVLASLKTLNYRSRLFSGASKNTEAPALWWLAFNATTQLCGGAWIIAKGAKALFWVPVHFTCCLPVGPVQTLRLSSEAVHRNCGSFPFCATLIVTCICKEGPSGTDFLGQNKKNSCSTLITWGTWGREWRKGKVIQREQGK